MAARRTSVPAPEKPSTAAPVLDAIAAVPDVAGLERVEVDPKTLVLDTNARADLKITATFKRSVREHGVLVPLLCRRDPLGQLLVVDGQRRLVTALEVELASVPVAMLPPVGDDEARLWDQLVTNDQREPLTAAETAAAFQQLSLMGRSAAGIAKRAGVKLEVVESALAVASSKAAKAAAERTPDASLDELAGLAEFEGDADAVKVLREVMVRQPSQFGHTLQQLRDDRDFAAAIAARVAELGDVVVLKDPAYMTRGTEELDRLSDEPGGKPLTPKAHASCPGHAVYFYRRPRNQAGVMQLSEQWACTSWAKAGHVNRHANPSSGATSGPLTEEQKAERRALVANNKAAQAAEVVRCAFIREVLQRKTMPADAPSYVARLVRPGQHPTHPEQDLARQLVYGDKAIATKDADADLATPRLATRALIALAAARVEAGMPKDFWRHPHPEHGVHLRQLEVWGYVLSDVEQLALKTLGRKR